MDDLMATDKSFNKDDFYDDIWQALSYQNRIWAFPQNRHPMAVFYRTDLFNRYSATAPQTWNDYTQLIQKMTHAAQGQYATDEGTGDSNFWDVVQRSNGGTYLSADGTQVHLGQRCRSRIVAILCRSLSEVHHGAAQGDHQRV